MSKRRLDIGLVDYDLFRAIAEVAESEKASIASIARHALKHAFLHEEPDTEMLDNIRIFAISEEQLKRIGIIPVAGQVVDDSHLGNRVEFYQEGQSS